ncbi:hypothetical protein CEXT_143421 [Caerostris extrusa]|uniref:Uncharacterized protein n=1 Tax=Caerostris extrusa TaxID=172846 RepID=A0AAV4XNA1_CAEEX|nr:hypothetical protein CEXT_143421 [Caerostris extrusa]
MENRFNLRHAKNVYCALFPANSVFLSSRRNESLSRTSQTFPNPPFARHNERLIQCCAPKHTASRTNARIAASSASLLGSANPSSLIELWKPTGLNLLLRKMLNKNRVCCVCASTSCFNCIRWS